MEKPETYKTLRDEIAIAAMQGDWAAQSTAKGWFVPQMGDKALTIQATLYYRMADAMLKAREAE